MQFARITRTSNGKNKIQKFQSIGYVHLQYVFDQQIVIKCDDLLNLLEKKQ